MMSHAPLVFISYCHDTVEHQERVLDLADRLRADGIDAEVDQYNAAPPEGWPLWCERQIEAADVVLIVCTETYHRRVGGEEQPGKGLGVVWEAAIIRQLLYDAGAVSTKFVLVLFADGSPEHILTPVRSWSRYVVDTEDGYDGLYRRLTGQPRLPRPPLGAIRPLPSRDRRWSKGTREAASSSLLTEVTAEEGGRMEPVTTGALVAGALSAAAATLAKGMLGEAAKDAYKKLKDRISAWVGHDVESLEKDPESTAREAVIAESVDRRDNGEKQDLSVLAQKLISSLGDEGKAAAGTRITVIAKHGGMAAGRDQTINFAPPPAAEGKKGS